MRGKVVIFTVAASKGELLKPQMCEMSLCPLDHRQSERGQSNPGSGSGTLQGIGCESLHQQG